MRWKLLATESASSPVPARSIADIELDEKQCKPDFEITAKFQAFSKELGRISLLGLGAYGFLIKLGTGEKGEPGKAFTALLNHRTLAEVGVAAFASCAACCLFHGFLASKCLAYQLVIVRYLNRLEGTRWQPEYKNQFREFIKQQQASQRVVLKFGTGLLFVATLALILGAVMVAFCSVLVLRDTSRAVSVYGQTPQSWHRDKCLLSHGTVYIARFRG